MQIKLLENIIMKVAGKAACDVLEFIYGKKDVNEFLIAKRLGLTINQVRNILYKLSNHHLVFFTRKKDKRKGWYTYYWTLDVKKCLDFMKKELEKEKQLLENNLKNRISRRFYECKDCVVEVNEENALIHDFFCAECGGVYTLSENQKVIDEINPEIARKERQIQLIDFELKKLEEEESKKRARLERKKKKEKEKEKMDKKMARKKLSQKNLGKKEKKTVKKKTTKKKVSIKKNSKKKSAKKIVKKKTVKKKIVKKKTVKKKIVKKKTIGKKSVKKKKR